MSHFTRSFAMRSRRTIATAAIAFACAALLVQGGAAQAATQNFTVTNTADSGAGSLRQALTDANASTATVKRILLQIPTSDSGFGGGVFTIRPLSALPVLRNGIQIDGAYQRGYTGNTNLVGPEVVLSGVSAGPTTPGLRISGDGNIVRELVINRFGGAALGADYGIDTTPSDNQFVLNYVGVDPTGMSAMANGGGVDLHGFGSPGVQATNNLISTNVISSNGGYGISLCDAGGTRILNNKIGTDRLGTGSLGNSGPGINMICAGDRDATIKGNTIAFNAGDGISDLPDYRYCATCHASNRITRNSIFSNSGLAVNLQPPPFGVTDGVTPNDPGDSDTGGNGLQNFPVLASAGSDDLSTTIAGTLNSTPGATFLVELFSNDSADPSGYGEAQRFAGGVYVTTDGSGNASFNVMVTPMIATGKFVTATATDAAGNTSEVSAAKVVSALPA